MVRAQVIQAGVGCAATVQWYAAPGWRPADWLRAMWNGCALSAMTTLDWPWAGGAVRRELVDEGAPARLSCFCKRPGVMYNHSRQCARRSCRRQPQLCPHRFVRRAHAGVWTASLAQTIADDTSLVKALRAGGWRYSFVPAAMSFSQDSGATMRGALRLLHRSNFLTRMDHPQARRAERREGVQGGGYDVILP